MSSSNMLIVAAPSPTQIIIHRPVVKFSSSNHRLFLGLPQNRASARLNVIPSTLCRTNRKSINLFANGTSKSRKSSKSSNTNTKHNVVVARKCAWPYRDIEHLRRKRDMRIREILVVPDRDDVLSSFDYIDELTRNEIREFVNARAQYDRPLELTSNTVTVTGSSISCNSPTTLNNSVFSN